MFTYRCDKCKKEILDRKEMVSAGKGTFPGTVLCAQCGKPVLRFLAREGLLEDGKERVKRMRMPKV